LNGDNHSNLNVLDTPTSRQILKNVILILIDLGVAANDNTNGKNPIENILFVR
jgi:hypothetical protein